MGCTPSKQIDASREDSEATERDLSVTEETTKNDGYNANGNSRTNSNGTGNEKARNKNNTDVDSKLNKSRRILAAKSDKKCTQSQLDFFEMLDKRIEAGADYASEDEKCRNAWTEKSYRACGQYQSNNLHRKHYYGSLDKLYKEPKPEDVLIVPGRKIHRYRVEPGIADLSGLYQSSAATHLENPEFQTRWYFKYFLGQVHNNYIGLNDKKEPYALSVCLTAADNHGIPQYRAILWKASGCQRLCFPYKPAKIMSPREVLRMFSNVVDKAPYEIVEAEIQRELIVLEEQEGSVNFKFGVIYAKAGQVTDNEMFSNATGSEEFESFLDLLGDRVSLKGFKNYKGGLDVKNNTTGTESIYTVSEGHEIMFHVSTMLPHSTDHSQQVERKRHIGNDIVVVVYIDGPPSGKPAFSPSFIRSKFTHVFAVVCFDKTDDSYWLYVYSEENVPVFGPPLPNPSVFHDENEFRSFLLTKLMNGEKAAYFSPVFSQKRQRTLEALLKGLHTDHLNLRERFSLRRSFRGTPRSPRRPRKRSEGKRRAFVETGQLLKVNKILQGDAPTSLANSGGTVIPRNSPWEPDCITSVFPLKIICGDSFGDGLILATDRGIYTVQGDSFRHIFDSSLQVQQINVLETQGIVILRTKKTRTESKVYVIPIGELESTNNRIRNKEEITKYKLPRTKGIPTYVKAIKRKINHVNTLAHRALLVCSPFKLDPEMDTIKSAPIENGYAEDLISPFFRSHIYALNRPGSVEVLLAVGVHKKVYLFVWKVTPMWSFRHECDTPAGFEFEREFRLASTPLLLCLAIDSNNDVLLCCGYKDRFDLTNIETKNCHTLRKLESKKVTRLVSALDVYEDDNPEILLTYNHFSIFQRLDVKDTHNVSFYWNSTPHAVVCAFPYVIGFTPNTIEIRLVVNGNMVHTIAFPNVQFITGKSDIYFSTSKKTSEQELLETSNMKRRKSSKRPRHIIPTSIYRIALNSLVGTQLFESTGLSKSDEVFATPARWDSSENEDELDSTPVSYSTTSTNEEKVRLRRKYSNATAMASPVLSPILKPVMKMIDFGEDIRESNTDIDFIEPYSVRSIRVSSPVAASDPDLTRARISRETRLKSLLQSGGSSKIKEPVIKQETVL